MAPTRVLFFGTHPNQFNGYSKVVYELVKELATHHADRVTMGVFGFQGLATPQPIRESLPPSVFVHDVLAHEEPKAQGFGPDQVPGVVEQFKPDVCVIYNDAVVTTEIVKRLAAMPSRPSFKIILYLDQVYLNVKRVFLDFFNKHADMVVAFTKDWAECIEKQGITAPVRYLPHGLNTRTYFPVPKKIARDYLQLGGKKEDFIVLNLNRNQPRKRWDICLKAMAEVVSRRPDAPIKLLIATAVQGAWNLLEIFERELKKRDLTMEDGLKHLIVIDAPQRLSDYDINVLYSAADVGLNTCDGEGFGLCNFEQAAVGVPQIVPRLGGFTEFLDDERAIMVDPILAYYSDSSRDMAGGEALLCDYRDFAEAIINYYDNRNLVVEHGARSRKHILESGRFLWSQVASKFCDIVDEAAPPPPKATAVDTIEKVLSPDELQEFFAPSTKRHVLGVDAVPLKKKKRSKTAALLREVSALKQQIASLRTA